MNRALREWLLPPAAACLAAGILLGRSVPSPLWVLPVLALAMAAVFLLRERLRFAACLVLCLTLGIFTASLAWHPDLPAEGEYEVRGIICREIQRGHYGQVRTELTSLSLDGRPFSAGGYWSFYTDEELPPDLLPGKEVSFRASLYHPSGTENPDGYDFREELLRRGVTVGLYGAENLTVSAPSQPSFSGAAASLRDRLSRRLTSLLGEEAGGYAAALLFGSRSLVPSEDRAAFARLGIAHLLSVSGFHVGILTAMLGFVFRRLRLRPSLRLGLYGVLLLGYCLLCGMNAPVVRASLLLLLALSGKLLNRPRIGLHLLCGSAFVMLLLSPVQLTGVSFQMTFGAMLGIVLIAPTLNGLFSFRHSWAKKLWSSFTVMIGAQAGVLLPVLSTYQKLPLLGLVVSLPATLVFSLLIVLYWVILLLLPLPFLSGLLAGPGAWVTSLLLRWVRGLAALPGISVWTPAATLLTVLGVLIVFIGLCVHLNLSGRRRLLLSAGGVLVVTLSLLPLPHRDTEYVQFSVGNADAAVLHDQDTVWVLDTGTDDGVLSGYLRRRRLTPDAVILTHLHTDHAGGLQSLVDDEIPIPLIYLPAGAEEQIIHEDIRSLLASLRASGTEIRTLSRGDRLDLPSGSLTVLWPEAGKTRPGQDANHYSLVCRLSLQGVSLLHCGDISGEYEMYAAEKADLLKAAHHGSPSSSSPAFLQAVSPGAVLLSCNALSRDVDFQERLGSIPVYSTARHGAITVRFEEGACSLIPFQ